MKIYKDVFVSEKKIIDVFCNMCGQKIEKVNNDTFCDYFHAIKEWGYFSDMDTKKHSFDLCQKCYKEIIGQFKISVTEESIKGKDKDNDKETEEEKAD